MSADILTNIQNDIHAFSKGQKKIAAYILSNYDKAAFMTASRLGKTVEVSESTVVRFAVELGYEGYPEMQKTLQELVRNKLTSVQRIEVASDQFGNQDVVSSVLQRDANAIRMTSDALDRGQMARAVEGSWPRGTSISSASARPRRWPITSISISAIFLTTSASSPPRPQARCLSSCCAWGRKTSSSASACRAIPAAR